MKLSAGMKKFPLLALQTITKFNNRWIIGFSFPQPKDVEFNLVDIFINLIFIELKNNTVLYVIKVDSTFHCCVFFPHQTKSSFLFICFFLTAIPSGVKIRNISFFVQSCTVPLNVKNICSIEKCINFFTNLGFTNV